jgi:hypothetical protein
MVHYVRIRVKTDAFKELCEWKGYLSHKFDKPLSTDETIREMGLVMKALSPSALDQATELRKRARASTSSILIPRTHNH